MPPFQSNVLQQKPESWNMTVPQPQSLEKKEHRHKSSNSLESTTRDLKIIFNFCYLQS